MKKAFIALACTLGLTGALATQGACAQASAASAPTATAPAAPHAARVDERIASLHQQLKITPAQEPQWKAFADTMRKNGEQMDTLYQQRAQAPATQSALENMRQYAAIAQAHADGMQKLVTAFEPLYTSMSADQKKVADTAFRERANGPHGRMQREGKARQPQPQ
jgi:phage shock protein A